MKVVGTFLNLILLAGTALLLIFVILSGSTDHFPFNRFYWVRGETSSISGAYDESAWTFWGVCEYGNYSNCKVGPAYPISPVDNFGTSQSVPSDFVDNRDTFYYLTRFAFAFFLIALGFVFFALLVDFLGFCFTVIDKVVMVFVVIALIFVAGGAAMETAAIVLAKNAFSNNGNLAHVGVKMLGMVWAAVACMFIVFFLTCCANITNSYKKHITRVNEAKNQDEGYYKENSSERAVGDDSSYTRGADMETNQPNSGGIRFFRIMRNQKPSDEESV